MSNYIHIFTGMGFLVHRLKHLLEDAGINALIKDHNESGRLAGFGTPANAVELFILKTTEEEATPIIEKFKKEILE